jgi:hypothetical protein
MLAPAEAAANRGHSESAPVAPAACRAEMAPIAALESVADVRGEVPVVVLVAGAGFLGTGTTAALLEREKSGTAADIPRPREDGARRLRLA